MVDNQEQAPVVKLRERNVNAAAQLALARGMEVLNEGETTEETEEIRKLDTQLDHLNDYMTQMEQRLKEHNEKMMVIIKQQKEEREKRRKSFHERMSQTQTEDEEFKKQINNILKRVQSVKKASPETE